jgi:hypothetical protein
MSFPAMADAQVDSSLAGSYQASPVKSMIYGRGMRGIVLSRSGLLVG